MCSKTSRRQFLKTIGLGVAALGTYLRSDVRAASRENPASAYPEKVKQMIDLQAIMEKRVRNATDKCN